MGNISNSLLLDEIDFIAAVAKAQAESYSATVDAYDIMVREQNPDDLLRGVDASVALRTTLANMSSLYGQFTQMSAWFNARAVSAGYSSLDGLLTGRGIRVPYSYDRYVHYPTGSHLSVGNIFYDSEVTMGYLLKGGSYSGMSDLTLSGTYNWLALKVGVPTIAAAWYLDADVVYADASTGSERVTVAALSVEDDTETIGSMPISALAKAGQNLVGATLGTTGMLAGQKVLLSDKWVPSLLATGADSGQAYLYLSPSQIGWYDTGDHIWIRDGSNSETGIIEDINWQDGNMMLRANLTNSYTVAANANIYKATGPANMEGWTEMHTIASVSAAQALAFSAALQHTYFTGSTAVRLIRDVYDITEVSGGTASDVVYVVTKSERTISQ